MKKNQEAMKIADTPLYHDTWKLLKKYRDMVWSLELSVQQCGAGLKSSMGVLLKISWSPSMLGLLPAAKKFNTNSFQSTDISCKI